MTTNSNPADFATAKKGNPDNTDFSSGKPGTETVRAVLRTTAIFLFEIFTVYKHSNKRATLVA